MDSQDFTAPLMYGAEVRWIFQHFLQMAVLLYRKGVEIAKPHLKTVACNITQDVVSHVTHSIMNKLSPQDGTLVWKNV